MMKIAICGYGGHGKGTVAQYLSKYTSLRYKESTSMAASSLVMFPLLKDRYATANEAWLDRHNHRAAWAEGIWQYNLTDTDGLRLYMAMLPDNDILEGVRKSDELYKLRERRLIQLTVWVDAIKRVPREPESSCQICAADCDVIIDNNGSMSELVVTMDTFITNFLSSVKVMKC